MAFVKKPPRQVPDKAFAKAADTTEGREGAAGGQDPRPGAGANSLLISKS